MQLFKLLDLLIILILSLAGYAQLLKPGAVVFSRHSDLLAYGLGAFHVVYGVFGKLKDISFWRPDIFSGYPAFSNPQMPFTDVLCLPAFFFDFPKVANLILWFHFLLSGVIFYLSGRLYGFKRATAIFLGVCGLFSFKLIIAAYAGWMSVLSAVIFYPLLFALVWRLADKPSLKTALALIAAGLLIIHAGHFQALYYAVLFLALYLIWLFAEPGSETRRGSAVMTAAYLSIVIFFCAGLSAFRYLPAAYDALRFVRGNITYPFFLSGHSFNFRHLATFLNPEILGMPLDNTYAKIELWEDAAYFGIAPLLLAACGSALGMLQSRDAARKNLAACFTVFFCLSLFLCFESPVGMALYNYFPLFKMFRIPGRFLFLTVFFGTMLAGIGFEEITTYLGKRPSAFLPRLFVIAALLTVTAEGARYSRRYLQTMPVSFLEQKDACAQYLKNDNSLFRIARIPSMAANYDMDEGAGLQFATGYDPFNLKHYGMYFDIANYGKAHPGFNHVKAELNRLSRADLLDALNVKYLVSAAPLAGLNDNYKLIRQFRKQYFYKLYEGFQCSDTYLYENLNAKPRAYWASRVISADDEAQAASLLENNGISDTAIVINPKLSLGARTEAKEAEIFSTQKAQRIVIPFARFLRKKTSSIFRRIPRPNENFGFKGKPMNEASKVSVNATVKVESFSAGHLALETVNSEPGFLVVSEIWHPGWKAEIDGAPAKIYQTDLALMGLYAPQGRHKVRLNFLPYGLVAGALISLLSLAALFIIVLRRENVEALIERLERLRKLDKAF